MPTRRLGECEPTSTKEKPVKLRHATPLLLVLLSLSSMARAEPPLVMATGEWRPYTSSTMEGYGEFTRRVSAVVEEMGRKAEYRFYPWARCYDAVVKGRVWAAFPYARSEERAREVWYSKPLSLSRTLFFYYDPPGDPKRFEVEALSDLKRYRVGGVTGYFYEEMFREAGLDIDYANKEVQGMEKLRRGRIDLMPVNEHVGRELVREHFPEDADRFKTLDHVLSVNDLSLIVSRSYPGSKQLLRAFDAALERCKEKGTIQSP